MNPFFTWVGGKRSLVDAILSKFPHDYGRYIEVFGGGGVACGADSGVCSGSGV